VLPVGEIKLINSWWERWSRDYITWSCIKYCTSFGQVVLKIA